MGLKYDKIAYLIDLAIEEDLGDNHEDITTDNLSTDISRKAVLINKEPVLIAGLDIIEHVYRKFDKNIEVKYMVDDGDYLKQKNIIAEITGNMRSILKGERIMLNFLQRMCGIATKTYKFNKILDNDKIKIADTRKTLPAYRYIDKYSVKVGGGINHRMDLKDMVMIKDNHKAVEGSLKKAFNKIKSRVPMSKKIDVEVDSIYEAEEAAKLGADIIMLDNMSNEEIRDASKMIRNINKNIIIEVSGGVDQGRLRGLAKLDIDVISIGALTHSVDASDISMKIEN